MMRNKEELEKIAKALREMIIVSMQSINEAANLNSAESNGVIVGVMQSVYAELVAAMIVSAKPGRQEDIRNLTTRTFEKNLENAILRETKLREAAGKLTGMSSSEIADRLSQEYSLDENEDSDDDRDDPSKDPKNFN